ncbi:MAG: transketolase [Myxococcota bacterium]|jgi:transketolase
MQDNSPRSNSSLATPRRVGWRGLATPLDERSKALRESVIDILGASRRGHLGSTFSLIEIIRVLYDDILQIDPSHPNAADRDRFILSKGHGCLALYVLLADKGFFPRERLAEFCADGGMLGGHPDHLKVPGVEASTGSLGHGASIGVGMALHAQKRGANHRVFVALGDGECNEGSVWEAAMCASKHGLSNLTFIVDYNKCQSYGATIDVQDLEPFGDKWRSFGCAVQEVDGHNLDALRDAFTESSIGGDRPNTVICHTVKGKGIPVAEFNAAYHHKSQISDEDLASYRSALGAY